MYTGNIAFEPLTISSQPHYSGLPISEPEIQGGNLIGLFEDAAEFACNISVELDLAHLAGPSTEKFPTSAQVVHPLVATEHSIHESRKLILI